MFKHTDRQVSLWEPAQQAAESTRKRLRDSWADGFAAKILPVLLDAEDSFAALYDASNGRPNWSVARMLGVCLLQEMRDLDDQSALDSLAFDMRWQHALGLSAAEAYLSRRSLVDFRSRLVTLDPEMNIVRQLFEQIGSAAIDDLKISTTEQRIDGTLIRSNIYTRGRVDLFRKTLLHFLEWLAKEKPAKLSRLSANTRAWYERAQKDGWFGRVDKERYKQLLKDLAAKLYETVQVFADDKDVNDEESYLLVARLFSEHCEMEQDSNRDGSGGSAPGQNAGSGDRDKDDEVSPVSVLKKAKNPGSSLQSPYDPDAACGHKGPGYNVQITETCRNVDAAVEIITDYDVLRGNETDRGKEASVLKRLSAAKCQPETLYADGGYPTGQGILDAASKGTEIVSPMSGGKLPADTIGREAFTFDDVSGDCTQCPQGHAPTRHGMRTTGQNLPPTMHAYFDGTTCRACPQLPRCVVRGPTNGKSGSFHLEVGAHLVVRDLNLAAQRETSWWERYKIRSGVEATMSELKRQHGMGTLRVRRMPRVKLAVSFKVTACNIKRWMRVAAVGYLPARLEGGRRLAPQTAAYALWHAFWRSFPRSGGGFLPVAA